MVCHQFYCFCSHLGEPQNLLILSIAFVSCNSHEVPFVILAQVLFDLFHHDLRLWKAYSITLKVNLIHHFLVSLTSFVSLTVGSCASQTHPSFSEYHDLLEILEEKHSSTSNSEET